MERTTGSLSWVAQLQGYMRAAAQAHPQHASSRKLLCDVVLDNPNSADAWLSFLEHEEGVLCAPGGADAGGRSEEEAARSSASLYMLYHKATELVQRSKGKPLEAYVKIWVGYARHQWQRSEDEGRDTFKTLKNQHIADTNALLFHAWASLEAGSGHPDKARGILAKAIKDNAQPACILQGLLAQLQADPPAASADQPHPPATPYAAAAAAAAAPAPAARPLRAAPAAACPPPAAAEPSCHPFKTPHAPVHVHGAGAATGPRGGCLTSTSGLGLHAHTHHHTTHSTSSSGQSSVGSLHGAGHLHLVPPPPSTGALASRTMHSISSSDEDHHHLYKGSDATATMTSAAASEGEGEEGDASLRAFGGRERNGGGGGTTNHSLATHHSGSNGGNHTGQMAIKRFGFKSKALRVTSAGGEAAGAVEGGQAGGAGGDPVAGGCTDTLADAGAGRLQGPEVEGRGGDGSGEEGRDSRKRRAGGSGRQSPRNPAAVVDDGAKRRTSPVLQLGGARGEGAGGAPACAPVAPEQAGAAARAPSLPPASLGQCKQAHPDSENQAPRPPLGQALGVAGAHRPGQELPGKPSQQTGLKQGVQVQVQPQQAQPQPQHPVRSHREPLRAVQAPAQHQQELQAGAGAAAQRAPTHGAVAAAGPEQGSSGAAGAAQPPVQPPAQHRPQQAAAAGAPPAHHQPDLRAAPPERLPEPQTRAMEDASWVYVAGVRYQKLDCVGRGGSSKVFKVLGCNRQIYALKRVRLANKDAEAISGFIDEIALLKRLRDTPNIIQLIAAQVFREEGLIYMVLEYGDIDLARLLQNHEDARRRAAGAAAAAATAPAAPAPPAAAAGGGGGEIDDNFIRLYWQQMLQAVGGIHDMRIVHSDLKPANFLLVQGQLKLIDFGIAKSIQGDTTSIDRESQVGTLNYMSPEAIQGGSSNPMGGAPLKVGRPSDVWSLGCILYQMVYGQTPFADIPFIPKLNAICNPAHAIRFPACSNPAAADVMRLCLDRNPRTRVTIPELLGHAFLHPERAAAVPAVPGPGAALGALTEQALKTLVSQIALAGASGTADIDSLTRQVLAQLSGAQPHAAPVPGPPPTATAPHPPSKHVRPATPARCPVPPSPECEQSPMDADDALHSAGGQAQQLAGGRGEAGGGAEAALRAGLERFRFDDDGGP